MHYIFKSPQCTKPENVDKAPYKDSCEEPYASSLQISMLNELLDLNLFHIFN